VKAAGKARISAAQDSGTANKHCVDHEVMDFIHSPPQELPIGEGKVNWEVPFLYSLPSVPRTLPLFPLSSLRTARKRPAALKRPL